MTEPAPRKDFKNMTEKELLEYLDQQERKRGGTRRPSEMTTDEQLAYLQSLDDFPRIKAIEDRISKLEKKEEKVSARDGEILQLLTQIATRLDALITRLDAKSAAQNNDDLTEKLKELEENSRRMATKSQALGEKLERDRIEDLRERIMVLEREQLKSLSERIERENEVKVLKTQLNRIEARQEEQKRQDQFFFWFLVLGLGFIVVWLLLLR